MATFTERMVGAATLNAPTYEEVEHDQTATGQAVAVVALVAIASAIGAIGTGGFGVIGALISAFIGWVIWAVVTLLIGTRVFGGTADLGEMLRTLGFAQSIGVLNVLGFIPFVGWLARLVAFVWMLVCGVVAVRQAMDFDTGKALGTVIIGWLCYIVLGGILVGIFGGPDIL